MDAKTPVDSTWTPYRRQPDSTRSGLLIAFTRGRPPHVDSLLLRESASPLHDATRQHFEAVGGHLHDRVDQRMFTVDAQQYSPTCGPFRTLT
jgi:hypothetical protein